MQTTDLEPDETEAPAAAPSASEGDRERVRVDVQNRLLGVLVLLAVLYTVYLAAELILPIVLAIFIALMLAPIVRALCRLRIPRFLAAILVMAMLVGLFAGTAFILFEPAKDWMATLPKAVNRIEQVLRELRKPIAAATEATEELAEIAGNAVDAGQKGTVVTAVADEPGFAEQVMARFPGVIASIVATLFLTTLFLVRGDAVFRKVVGLAPALQQKKSVVETTRNAQHELSVYALTITAVNIVLGALVTVALWLLGVQQPLLWGCLAAITNYAPYVGPLVMASVLTIVGFGEFDSVGHALAVPGIYIVMNLVESEIVTPFTVGHRLELDPLVVLLSLIVLGWIWGIAGVLLAVPLLTCLRIVAEKVPSMEVVAKVLAK